MKKSVKKPVKKQPKAKAPRARKSDPEQKFLLDTEGTTTIPPPFIPPSKLSASLAKKTVQDNSPHVIVEARAGTGKTTTLVEGLKRVKGLPTSITPSPQQEAVWKAMEMSKDARSICFVAFNKSIAEELKRRVPEGCDAMTMHSMGLKAVTLAFGRVEINSYRVQDIIAEILETDIRELRRTKPVVVQATEQLVNLCRVNLTGFFGVESFRPTKPGEEVCWQEALADLASYYDIDLNGQSAEVFDLVPRVLERCKDAQRDNCVDFSDMIWLPVVLGLPVYKYDLLLVDEAQDLSRVQQALAKMAGRRLILCGDPAQAIYGFAGADCESMSRLEAELRETDAGCVHLPLTVTRRCGKAIVREAQKYVPDFSAFDTNPEGIVCRAVMKPVDGCIGGYQAVTQDGDMILCRCNAPLVSECFRFLRMNRKANIQGRDVGQGLISTVNKLCKPHDPSTVAIPTLIQCLEEWLRKEQAKENAKRNPSEARLIALQDRHDCLVCFTEGARTSADVVKKIDSVFTDEKNGRGIMLSSIHKSKGLEAKRVFFLRPEGAGCPHPMAKTAWAKHQELNLCYVAITRAIEELVYVD